MIDDGRFAEFRAALLSLAVVVLRAAASDLELLAAWVRGRT